MSQNVASAVFSASQTVSTIKRTFAAGGTLAWTNTQFAGGSARFAIDPTGLLYSFFSGSIPTTYTAVSLSIGKSSNFFWLRGIVGTKAYLFFFP